MAEKTDSNEKYNKIYCSENKPEPCGMVIFGASGDLSHRKLFPALFTLFERGLLPDRFFVVGCGRTHLTDEEFQDKVSGTLTYKKNISLSNIRDFTKKFFFLSGDNPEISPLYLYGSGTWGPKEADGLLEREGRYWLLSEDERRE